MTFDTRSKASTKKLALEALACKSAFSLRQPDGKYYSLSFSQFCQTLGLVIDTFAWRLLATGFLGLHPPEISSKFVAFVYETLNRFASFLFSVVFDRIFLLNQILVNIFTFLCCLNCGHNGPFFVFKCEYDCLDPPALGFLFVSKFIQLPYFWHLFVRLEGRLPIHLMESELAIYRALSDLGEAEIVEKWVVFYL